MAEDGYRTRAAAFIDDRFREQQHFLMLEHRRQEQRMLAFHKGQLQGFIHNREQAEMRYAQRLQTIENKRDQIADRLHRQHNSLGGRLQAMTKKGRMRQAEQLNRLDERMAQVQGRAHRNFAALQERQFQAEQRDRISRGREMKLFRLDHQEARQQHTQKHEQNRPQEIEQRAQAMRQHEAEQSLKREMQNVQQHEQGRTKAR